MTIPNATQAGLATHWKRRFIMLSRMRFCRSGALPWTVVLVLFCGIFGLPEFRVTKAVVAQVKKKTDPNTQPPGGIAGLAKSNQASAKKASAKKASAKTISVEKRLSLLERQLAAIHKLLLQQRGASRQTKRAPAPSLNPIGVESAPKPKRGKNPQHNRFGSQLPKAASRQLQPPQVQTLPPVRPAFPGQASTSAARSKVGHVYPM